jgi:hypothetical protein
MSSDDCKKCTDSGNSGLWIPCADGCKPCGRDDGYLNVASCVKAYDNGDRAECNCARECNGCVVTSAPAENYNYIAQFNRPVAYTALSATWNVKPKYTL